MKTILTNQKKKIALIFILLIGVLGIILIPNRQETISSFTLDVNPSIKISLDKDDDVVSVEAINEDAKKVLEGYKVTDNDLEDVIEEIVNRLLLNGYLVAGSNENTLLISGANEGVNEIIDVTLDNKKVTGNVYTQDDISDKEIMDKASKYQVSTGKMSIIEKIVNNVSVTYDELTKLSIRDIIEYARANNISLDFIDDQIDDIEDRLNKDIDHLDDIDDYADDTNHSSVKPQQPSVDNNYRDDDDDYDDDDRYDDDDDDRYVDDDDDDRYDDDDDDDRYDDDDDDDND